MRKFKIEAEFSLSTEISPEGISFDGGDSEDFSDDSYFSGESLSVSGGSLSFTVEAEDEISAESYAGDIISDGTEISDDNGVYWTVESVYFTVEQVEEPMTLERATAILRALAPDVENSDEVDEAISFILRTIAEQTAKISEQASKLSQLAIEVSGLKAAATAETVIPASPSTL